MQTSYVHPLQASLAFSPSPSVMFHTPTVTHPIPSLFYTSAKNIAAWSGKRRCLCLLRGRGWPISNQRKGGCVDLILTRGREGVNQKSLKFTCPLRLPLSKSQSDSYGEQHYHCCAAWPKLFILPNADNFSVSIWYVMYSYILEKNKTQLHLNTCQQGFPCYLAHMSCAEWSNSFGVPEPAELTSMNSSALKTGWTYSMALEYSCNLWGCSLHQTWGTTM